MKTLVLFDIDGTLLDARGEGRRGFYEALVRQFPGRDFPMLDLAGRTDYGVWMELAPSDRNGETFEAFAHSYAPLLAARLARRPPLAVAGSVAFFLEVARHPELVPCLVTGNFREGARLKMDALGLWGPFLAAGGLGAWGDGHLTKVGLCECLLAQWRERSLEPVQAVFLGDTAADLDCAAASGVPCILVGTAGGGADASRAVAVWKDYEAPQVSVEALSLLAAPPTP